VKIVIDEGLSTLRKGSGIGEHSWLLYHSLQQYAKELRSTEELVVELTNYSAWRTFPPKLQRLLYLSWTNTIGILWYKLQNVDLVHYTNYYIPFFRYPGVRYVVTIHDLSAYVVPDTLPTAYVQYARRAIQYAVSNADLIIADTKAIEQEIRENLTIDLDRVRVCYSGVKPIFRRCQKLTYYNKGDFLLFVGTIEHRKNLITLIKALSPVRKNRTLNDLRLILVGRKGAGFEEVKQAIHQEGLSDVISFTGYIPDDELVNLYNAALALVLPSKYEGFGIPLLEAMACETPIVASDIPAFREVAGEAALFYGDPEGQDSLAEAMETIVYDSALRRNLIEAGRLQVQNFSWERVAQEHVKAYEKALTIVT
jgi:glycosyltransferase involved in cell wall biosynthesis